MHRETGGALDLPGVLTEGYEVAGPGRYEPIRRVGTIEDRPVLTFTAEDPDALGRLARPRPTCAPWPQGSGESHGLERGRGGLPASRAPWSAEAWSAGELRECLAGPI